MINTPPCCTGEYDAVAVCVFEVFKIFVWFLQYFMPQFTLAIHIHILVKTATRPLAQLMLHDED